MSAKAYFKFKNTKLGDEVCFDGSFVSVAELKVLIAEKKGFGPTAHQELKLSDWDSGADLEDEYADVAAKRVRFTLSM